MSTLPEERLSELVTAHTETLNDAASFEDEAKAADASIQAIANNSELGTDQAIERVIKANAFKLLSETRATAKRQDLLRIETEMVALLPLAARRLKELSNNDPLLVVHDMPQGTGYQGPIIDQARDLVRRFGRLEVKTK